MATISRTTLPSAAMSLRQLVSHGLRVLRVDASGPALLIDRSKKKPACVTFDSATMPGAAPGSMTAVPWVSGAFTPDGGEVVLLAVNDDVRVRRVERFSVSGERLGSFDVDQGVESPWGVVAHAMDVLVFNSKEVLFYSRDGALERRVPRSSINQAGTHGLTVDDGEATVFSLANPGAVVRFKANRAVWANDTQVVAGNGFDEVELSVVDAATGTSRVLAKVPKVKALDAGFGRVWAAHLLGKANVVTCVPLAGGAAETLELTGKASEICVSATEAGAVVAVNWQKTLHVIDA